MAETFYYFGYGSNLLKQRLHLQNPSAVFVKPAKLENFKLCFGNTRKSWKGAVATITETCGKHVWGALWELNQEHRKTLDAQEGVAGGWYRPLEVSVTSEDNETFKCITYQLTSMYGPLDTPDGPPPDKPSPQYKDIIIRGAAQCCLPKSYIEKLKSIPDNGFSGTVALYESVIQNEIS